MGEVVMVGVGQAVTENRMGQRNVECKLAMHGLSKQGQCVSHLEMVLMNKVGANGWHRTED